MKKRIPIGVDDFEGLISGNSYYADKTRVIEELLDNMPTTDGKTVLFPRPRRFGKTLLMSMLNNFFDIDRKEKNKDLFNGLYINSSKYKDLQNTYPVINLSFKDLKQNTFESVVNQFRILIAREYGNKRYLLDSLDEADKKTFLSIRDQKSTIDDLKTSIRFLSECLYNYYNKKVIILIDEYDVPIQEGYLDGFYNDVIAFIRTILSSCLKTNESLAMGVLTGVLKVSKESIFSDLNNLKVYGLLDKQYEEFFGFTEEETQKLLEYYDLELTKEVKEMYDGYDFGDVNIYNPWSILNYVSDKKLDTFWVNTSGNDLIKDLLLKTTDENKTMIEKLSLGENLPFIYNDKLTYQDFDRYDDIQTILNIMFSSGYLTIGKKVESDLVGTKTYVKIPNLEVKELITNIMASSNHNSSNNLQVLEFNEILLNNDKENLEKMLNSMLSSLSYMDSGEYFYHAYMLGLLKAFLDNRYYVVKSNREAGNGRFDVSIRKTDNSIGFILEFKLANSEEEMESKAEEAINQMKEKEYYKELKLDGVDNIKEIAFVFYGKKVIVR